MGDGISRQSVPNYSYQTGFGYIILPIDIDRESYIKTCYRKERVAIRLDSGGGVFTNCFISKSAIQEIKFPATNDQLGSCVAYIVPEFHNIPIIVGVLSKADETQLLEENSFEKVVSTKQAKVSVSGKGKTGELFINVESENESEGNIYITLKSKDNTSKFQLSCFGDINIYSEGKTNLKALNQVNLESFYIEDNQQKISAKIILDENGFLFEDKFENKIQSNLEGKIEIHKGSQPILLGDETVIQLEKMKKRIDDLIDLLNTANQAITFEVGFRAILTAGISLLSLDKEDFGNIKSKKLFIE